MNITIEINDRLFDEMKRLAASRRQTMASLIEDALRQAIGKGTGRAPVPPVELPRSRERPGLRPGVDLDNTAALLDLMESEGDSPGR